MQRKSDPGYVISTEWLLKTAVDIEQGITTISQACMSVPIVNKRHKIMPKYIHRHISRNTLKNAFKKLGIELNSRPGRPSKPVYEQVKDKIVSIHKETKMGSTKVYETIIARSIEDTILRIVSHRAVYNTFKNV